MTRLSVAKPDRIAALPQDHRGYPIPWFVDWHDGEPVFPAFDPLKYVLAVRKKLCWVCGQELGRNLAFVVGPMCVINRISSEPPCHYECAQYSAEVCPFLANPRMGRVPASKLPGGHIQAPGGIMNPANPGVTAILVTRDYHVRETETGPIIQIGVPIRVVWYREGRVASPQEAADGFVKGAGFLLAGAIPEGSDSVRMCQRMIQAGALCLPDPSLVVGAQIQPDGVVTYESREPTRRE